jgi:hypothetical protein
LIVAEQLADSLAASQRLAAAEHVRQAAFRTLLVLNRNFALDDVIVHTPVIGLTPAKKMFIFDLLKQCRSG